MAYQNIGGLRTLKRLVKGLVGLGLEDSGEDAYVMHGGGSYPWLEVLTASMLTEESHASRELNVC